MTHIAHEEIDGRADKKIHVRGDCRSFRLRLAGVFRRRIGEQARQTEGHKRKYVVEKRAPGRYDIGALDQLQQRVGQRNDQAFSEAEVIAIDQQGQRRCGRDRSAVGQRKERNKAQRVRGGKADCAVGQIPRAALRRQPLALGRIGCQSDRSGDDGRHRCDEKKNLPPFGGNPAPVVFIEHKNLLQYRSEKGSIHVDV